MPLTATPGDPAANSYATVEEADAYNEDRAGGEAWADVDDDAKARSLILATSLLDLLPGAWTGTATLATQALGWPRTGMKNRNGYLIDPMTIPTILKNATSEMARITSQGERTDDDDVTNLGISSISAGPVSISFNGQSVDDASKSIVPESPTTTLNSRLMVTDYVRAMLVPSWFYPTVAQELAVNTATFLFVNLGHPRRRTR